jgi:hypothetical protein
MTFTDKTIWEADFSDDALPFGFLEDPTIRSFLGAGVWAADFLPDRFTYFFNKNKHYLRKDIYFVHVKNLKQWEADF